MSDQLVDANLVENFDVLIHKWCGYGRWQMTQLSLLSLVFFFLPFFSMSLMFVGATPNFKCSDGFPDNATYNNLPATLEGCPAIRHNASCTRWRYDQSVYTSTVVTQWDLVCSQKYMLSLLQSLLMLGGLTGSMLASQLGDVFGRKPVFLTATLLFVTTTLSAAFVENISVYAGNRFLTGIAMSMMIEGEMLIIAELVPPQKRAVYIFLMMAPFPIAIMIMSGMSFFIRSHTTLQIALAAPTVILLVNLLTLPESPRWLISKGKFQQAVKVFETGASWNGRKINDYDLLVSQMNNVREKDKFTASRQTSSSKLRTLVLNVQELLSTSRMRLNVAIGMYIRFASCCAYFGLSFDITQLSRNPFLAGTMAGLVEFPVYFMYPIINRIGRVRSTAASCVLTSASTLLVLAHNDRTLWLVLGLVGKLSVSLAFCMVYIHTPEYLPTSVRALGSALTQMSMRLGGAVAPFIVDLTSQWHSSVPGVIFGALMLVAGGLSLLLPETVNRPLPETVQQVDALYAPRVEHHSDTSDIELR